MKIYCKAGSVLVIEPLSPMQSDRIGACLKKDISVLPVALEQ